MVTFAYLNLVDDVYPSPLTNTMAMDVIFCRNVLMYLAPEQAQQVVYKLYHALADGGWLIVSPSEASHVLFASFQTVSNPGAILYRKDARRESPASRPHAIERQVPTQHSRRQTLGATPPGPTPYREALAWYQQRRSTGRDAARARLDDGPEAQRSHRLDAPKAHDTMRQRPAVGS
jgi:chemotaxis protein methyltransferase CheR